MFSGVVESVGSYLFILIISGARMTGAFILAPFFSAQLVTGTIRNLVIFNLTLIIVPMTMGAMPTEGLTTLYLAFITVKEVLIGVCFGFLFSLAFSAIEGMGSFIDTHRGSTMAQVMDPMAGEMSSVLGSFLMRLAITLFFCMGGFMLFMGILYKSYDIWPLFSTFPKFNDVRFPSMLLQLTDQLMRDIVLLAAPVSIVMFVVEFGLGLINRFAQQLNVFSLSMPIKSGVAAFMFIVYMPTLFILIKMLITDTQKWVNLFKQVVVL